MSKTLDSHDHGPAPHLQCARCERTTETFGIRGEQLCAECVKKYVHTKVVKRLEANRIRGGYNDASNAVLIPISLGVSSLSLVHILSTQLEERSNNSRHPGFSLHLLFVDSSSVLNQSYPDSNLAAVKELFSSHAFSVISIQECFDYDIDLMGIENIEVGACSKEGDVDHLQRLKQVFESLPDVSSRTDVDTKIRHRLIEAFAKRTGIENTLYGDTTTRLAERALAETAKGRGSMVPQHIADGKSPTGTVQIFPLRDLLRKEVDIYAKIVGIQVHALLDGGSASTSAPSLKGQSIDLLMQQYIANVEENYPSIVANVVRTSGKLKCQYNS